VVRLPRIVSSETIERDSRGLFENTTRTSPKEYEEKPRRTSESSRRSVTETRTGYSLERG